MARNGRSGGQEHVRLIAIDYHTVTGTARAECKGDQRSKIARRPESRTDSNSLTETQEQGDLEVEKEGQMKCYVRILKESGRCWERKVGGSGVCPADSY